MNEDKFLMWKLALSTIHADDHVGPEEEKWFKEKIKSLEENKILSFSDEQVQELSNVLHNPVENFMDEFKKINDPANAAFIIHILHIVSRLDKELHQKEKEIYAKLEKMILGNVDVEQTSAKVAKMEEDSYHEDEYYKVDNQHSLFEKALRSIQKVLNSGDYKKM